MLPSMAIPGNSYVAATIVLILAIMLLTLVRISHYPLFIDPYYHLSIMRLFDAAGGITSWDSLQFAPWGRPLLYPPLFPVLLSIPFAIGISPLSIAQGSSASVYPLTLIVVAYVTYSFYGARSAFLATLFTASLWMFMYKSSYLMPSSLAYVFILLSYLCIHRGRWIAAALLLSGAFYTHLSLPHICVVPLLAWAAIDSTARRSIVRSLALAYVLFIPWGVHLATNMGFIHSRSIVGYGTLNIVVALLAILGLAVSIDLVRAGQRRYVLFPALVCSLLVIVPYYSHRFFFHAVIPLSILAAIGLDRALESLTSLMPERGALLSTGVIVVMMIFSLCGAVVYEEGYSDDGTDIIEHRRMFIQESALMRLATGNIPAQSYVSNNDIITIVEAIREHTSPDDIILVDTGPLACVVTSLTGRATTNGMFKEVAPLETSYRKLPPLRAYLVRFRIEGTDPTHTVVATESLSLVVREDDEEFASRSVPSPSVPYAVAYAFVCLWALITIQDTWWKKT